MALAQPLTNSRRELASRERSDDWQSVTLTLRPAPPGEEHGTQGGGNQTEL